ncbi:hypothetical protein [Duganella sp. P38]|uniref:hypothetical protein n=1 Tax=Duganella sp. P38 TaxID=3423949 RepID=UPI003D792C72
MLQKWHSVSNCKDEAGFFPTLAHLFMMGGGMGKRSNWMWIALAALPLVAQAQGTFGDAGPGYGRAALAGAGAGHHAFEQYA